MKTTHISDREFFGAAISLIAVAGFVVFGVGASSDLLALRTAGLVTVITALVLGCFLVSAVSAPVFALLDWLDLVPISRFRNWLRSRREEAEQRAEKQAGPEVLIENQYRFFAARHEAVATPRDLRRVVTRLVRHLQRVGGLSCTLYGFTPMMKKRRVLRFGFSRVGYFLKHSEIRWNFGRAHSDPTHEIILVSRFNGTHAVYLRISFVLSTSNTSCPGLFAELRLTPSALGTSGPHASAQSERLFRVLVDTLDADFGHVEVPGQPECENWPYTPGKGPITFTAPPPEAHCENLKLCEQY